MRVSSLGLRSLGLRSLGLGLASLSLLALAPGCETRPMGTMDGGGVRDCLIDGDCDDGFDCTVETCGVGGICAYTTLDARCAAGESCVVGRGCVTGTTCTSSADCDDSVACTVDTCAVGGTCRHMALDELCTDSAAPSCDPVMGCVRGSGCMSAADCDDSVACTIDSCGADRMCSHTPMDSLCMAGEVCNTTTGCFASMPCDTAADCDDGVFCNGPERCQPEFGCMPGTPPACNDSDTCTIDTCDATLDMCAFTCDRTMAACSTRPGCETPTASCVGSFTVTPARPMRCVAGAAPNFGTTTFAYDGVVLTISDSAAGFPDLTDVIEPACPNFEATATVDGGCQEIYTIAGTFTDDDNFTGEFRAEYVDMDGFSCLIGGCSALYTTTLTGTRM